MKKYIFILFTACLFTSCNDGLLFDDYLNELGYEFEQTNLSALAVLTSADYWNDNYMERIYSTKPNCEGKIHRTKDYLTPVGLGGGTKISVTTDQIRFYSHNTTGVPAPPYNNYYSDCAILKVDNSELIFLNRLGTEVKWKIVMYDEDKIMIECSTSFQYDGIEYSYCRFILHKKMSYDDSWDDKYVSYEEYEEAYRQWHQDYWESKTIEYLEDYVAYELETGRSTLEQLHEYFQYYCPELYESTNRPDFEPL